MEREGVLSPAHWRSGGMVVGACYVMLGLADMALSSVAFIAGIPEVNPFLAWLAARGLFVPGKLLLTLAVGAAVAWLYSRRGGRAVGWVAVLTMLGVDVYHLWGLGWL